MPEELRDIGLENHEFCLWSISAAVNPIEAHQALAKFIPDFNSYLEKGQMEILPGKERYNRGEGHTVQTITDEWVEKINQALSRGFSGMRISQNTAWLKKAGIDFNEYELAVAESGEKQ